MNGYNFTERVRKVLALSREQAIQRGHEYVGCEHILLGLVAEGEGVACAVLQNMGVDLKEVTPRVDAVITRGKNDPRTLGPDLPYTSRAKKTLELAMASARDFEHSYVGTEHLLLGLIREEKSVAAQLLTALGAPAWHGRPPCSRARHAHRYREYHGDHSQEGRFSRDARIPESRDGNGVSP